MKKLIKISLFLLVVLIGVALIVPFLIPTETYKKEAVTRLSEMTGRDIAIDGAVSFRLLPDVAVVLGDVTIGNPAGFTSPHLAKIKNLNVGVALGPLFNKELAIQKFKLEDPDIYLEQLANGKQNWQIEFKAPELPSANLDIISSAQAQGAVAEKEEASFSLKKIELSELAISGGTLHYIADGKTQKVADISLSSDTVKVNEPTEIAGSFNFNGEDFAVNTRIASLEKLLANELVPTKLTVDSNHLKVNFDGEASTSSLRGAIDAGSPSIVNAMRWFGAPLDWKKTSLLFALKGQANCNLSQCSISKANIAVDDLRLNGAITLGYSGKPSITSELAADVLDLTPYIEAQAVSSAPVLSPLISSAHAQAHWDKTPIDLSALNAFNADVTLNAKQLIIPQTKADNLKLKAQVRNGSASLNILESRIFDGEIKGLITALPRNNYINLEADLNLAGIEIEQALLSLSGEAAIRGKTNLTAKLKAQGASVAGIMQSLAGTANLLVKDGAIKGVNLGKMARNLKTAFQANANESTDFAELSGSFSIRNGIVSNNDLAMKAPFLRMRGEGQVNLPAYQINYKVLPELVETSKGQGGKEKTGILVPVLITGSLDNPQYTPDLQAILNADNIDAVKDRIKDEKENIKNLKDQFKGIKEDIKRDPKELLKNPESIENLLNGFR